MKSFDVTLKEAGLTVSLDTNDDPENRWGAPLSAVLQDVDVFLPNYRGRFRHGSGGTEVFRDERLRDTFLREHGGFELLA